MVVHCNGLVALLDWYSSSYRHNTGPHRFTSPGCGVENACSNRPRSQPSLRSEAAPSNACAVPVPDVFRCTVTSHRAEAEAGVKGYELCVRDGHMGCVWMDLWFMFACMEVINAPCCCHYESEIENALFSVALWLGTVDLIYGCVCVFFFSSTVSFSDSTVLVPFSSSECHSLVKLRGHLLSRPQCLSGKWRKAKARERAFFKLWMGRFLIFEIPPYLNFR